MRIKIQQVFFLVFFRLTVWSCLLLEGGATNGSVCPIALHTVCKCVCPPATARSCADLFMNGHRTSGLYKIDPDGKGAFNVFCDQVTAGGGWTIFQKRLDGSVNFNRVWNEFKNGFGHLNGEYWLGLDKIHRLTQTPRNKLRIDLSDWKGAKAYAEYDNFVVKSEKAKYKVKFGRYSGTAGDSLSHHNGMAFSTKDRDNDKSKSGHCAASRYSGWWFRNCHYANLNGLYQRHGPYVSCCLGVVWFHWKGDNYSLKRTEMKIRPIDFLPK